MSTTATQTPTTNQAQANQSRPPALATNHPMTVMGQRYGIEPKRLHEILCNTVIKPTDKHTPTSEEVMAFSIVANQYQLNPFTREIHAFVSNGAIVPIVGIDGWVSLVNRHPDFNGCRFVETMDDKGAPLSTTCVMYTKDRQHPTEVTEWFVECKRNTIPWNTMPRRMLRHKAYMQAARYCFGFSGIYDEDEARDIIANGRVVDQPSQQQPPVGRVQLHPEKNGTPSQPAAQSIDVTATETQQQHELRREPGSDDAGLDEPMSFWEGYQWRLTNAQSKRGVSQDAFTWAMKHQDYPGLSVDDKRLVVKMAEDRKAELDQPPTTKQGSFVPSTNDAYGQP